MVVQKSPQTQACVTVLARWDFPYSHNAKEVGISIVAWLAGDKEAGGTLLSEDNSKDGTLDTSSQSVITRKPPILWFVIPCYNEEAVLPKTAPMFREVLGRMLEAGKVASQSCILFVNDGSSDSTWDLIKDLSSSCTYFRGVSLSRNRGHQNALLGGLYTALEAGADITISIDADGQDDIDASIDMVDAYLNGADVVYGVRSNRKTDSFFKRFTAESYYKFLNFMGADVVFNHSDYRLMSMRAMRNLLTFPERNLFLRGIVRMIGFPSATVEYERHERLAGKSHYPLSKMLGLAFDGITSLSVKPLAYVSMIGFFFSLMGLAGVLWAVVTAFMGNAVVGWSSTVAIISLIGGIQLMALGVIGTYIGKIYLETKARPRFIISETTWERD